MYQTKLVVTINEQTKISALLKHNPAVLEAIISLSPDFKKLRNPFLRKVMAGRTSIKMASKIGGCTPQDFFDILQDFGFEIDPKITVEEEIEEKENLAIYLKTLNPKQIISFDVREILAEGGDPLRSIQQKIKEMPNGFVLKIINTFEPIPLINILEKQNLKVFVNRISDKRVDTYFHKNSTNLELHVEDKVNDSLDWDEIYKLFESNLVKIDVRHLEMPLPMMTILETLETLPDKKALYVHHKKVPIFLLTELKERSFDYRIKEIKGNVDLLIFKNK